jgi:hypothetical protein
VTVAVKAAAETATATIGPLEDETPSVADAAGQTAAPAAEAPPPQPPSTLSGRRTMALAAAGIGVIGAGLGTFFGIRAIQKHDDPEATCTTNPCSSQSVSLNNQAKFAADAATVSFIVAVAGLGAGAVLWFGDPASGGRAVTVVPSVTSNGGGLGASGRF